VPFTGTVLRLHSFSQIQRLPRTHLQLGRRFQRRLFSTTQAGASTPQPHGSNRQRPQTLKAVSRYQLPRHLRWAQREDPLKRGDGEGEGEATRKHKHATIDEDGDDGNDNGRRRRIGRVGHFVVIVGRSGRALSSLVRRGTSASVRRTDGRTNGRLSELFGVTFCQSGRSPPLPPS